tara:strand:+ start:44983 stop:45087 length:105 start_codon:yes stop_codon:yes gene_type:complete
MQYFILDMGTQAGSLRLKAVHPLDACPIDYVSDT